MESEQVGAEYSEFADPAGAARAFDSFVEVLGEPLPSGFATHFSDSADPDLALTNLGRWLSATANPQAHLQQLVAVPVLARLLVGIFGASQPITDSLIQNPELASIVLDPSELGRPLTREGVLREGRSMLAAATSYSHALDRLRFLKQRWSLPLVINDLAGTWAEETVWRGLSVLASALIELSAETVWREYAKDPDLPKKCPVMIVGFGKLGGDELNFSSDVDLAFAIPDGRGEEFEGHATRFCELLGRALSDRMGRGSIYRIDLRLRPYGNSGPIVASMRGFEAYYALYAEQWEIQALIRSNPVCGPEELTSRWESLRVERCFRPQLSEPELDAMLEMKTRIEERSIPDDIKRGAGGIRDVEFLVQALQLIHGHRIPALQTRPTLDTLRELDRQGILDHAVAHSLERGYTFLRQLEHRCQLVGDQQTHSVPADEASRARLAKLMGIGSWREVEQLLEAHRRTIQTVYKSVLKPERSAGDPRGEIAERLGPNAPSILQWFDSLPSPELFYASLFENRDSLDRVAKLALAAPRLVNDLKSMVGLTEMLLSGEIEEAGNISEAMHRLPASATPKTLAQTFLRAKAHLGSRWVLTGGQEVGKEASDLYDALIRHCVNRLGARFDVIGLGSYGGQEMSLDSDADLVFLVTNPANQSSAELDAQQFLSLVGQLKRVGAPISVDLRLRPDGGKGMLVRSLEAMEAYDLSGMEMWERFALGQAREVVGDGRSLALIRHIAYAKPLTPERLGELLAMKKRVESERVRPQHVLRDVKLGQGGLNDIEWFVHLLEMRYPTATRSETQPQAGDMRSRIERLARAALVNAVEAEQILEGFAHLSEVRHRLALQGLEGNILPENPDKLDRLAKSMEIETGNDFLAIHNRVIEVVRAIYLQGLERLKA